jgi:SAM-dependent methyltransferase
MLRFAARTLARLNAGRIQKIFNRARYRISETWYEWRFGIETAAPVFLLDVGVENSQSIDYGPAEYRTLRKVMNTLTIQRGRDVFLDYGSGKGRVVVFAARYPFRKVIGIEISDQLNDIARENIRRARSRLLCKDIDIVHGDASLYPLPPDVTFLFFYHPFRGETLLKVVETVRKSLAENPRVLTIIYKNPEHFETTVGTSDWLVKRREFTTLGGKRLVVYETRH